jgi:hypothetical protein
MFKNPFSKNDANDNSLYLPRMPEVDLSLKIEDVFNEARKAALGETRPPGAAPNDRFLILVTPGRLLMHKPCPVAGSIPESQVAALEKMLPSLIKRNIAVIAYTDLQAVTNQISRAIPFVGMLLGFAYIGHAVWIFEGHPSALAAGCQDADLLLVDGGMLPYLAENWVEIAADSMRNKEIYVHERATFKLTRLAMK